MSREEYFALCLKRDFIRYVLLRRPRFTDHAVSLKLRSQIAPDYLCDQMEKLVDDVISQALNIVKTRIESGELNMSQPHWLSDVIIAELKPAFEKMAAEILDIRKAVLQLTDVIEKLTWEQGVDDMAVNLKAFLCDLQSDMNSMSDLPVMSTPYNYDLERKFEAAEHISIRERVMGDNYVDVLELSSAINAFAKDECKNLMYGLVAEFYSKILADATIPGYIAAFETAHKVANAEVEKLRFMTDDSEWTAEYRAIMPIDFYERNVEDIDGAMAFRMILFRSFARNEAYLREHNYLLPDGRLRIFTSPCFNPENCTDINLLPLLEA